MSEKPLNPKLTDSQKTMITILKDLVIKNQKYELACDIRTLETNQDLTKEETESEFERLNLKCLKISVVPNIVGDSYTISEEATIEANALLEKATALRTEAKIILESANAIHNACFELLRKDNTNIPKDASLTFLFETKKVIVIEP